MSEDTPIQILLADDSPISRRLLSDLIHSTADMVVVGEASTGLEAVRMNHALLPQVIAMDINMPVMDGLQATQIIMQEQPTRIVMLGTLTQTLDADLLQKVQMIGALDFCPKPHNPEDVISCERFLKTLRAMSQVGVVRVARSAAEMMAFLDDFPGLTRTPEIVLVVSSTGGPQALEVIIRALPPDFPLPIVVVQHMSEGFYDNMTMWLDGVTPLVVKLAENGERPQVGHIYFAPAGVHLRLSFNGRFVLSPDTENYRHVPSGDVLLESAAKTYGANAIGVVLTGMGMDGAQGLTDMRKQGAHTIVQDEETSVVFGMPKAAIELGASEYILAVEDIASLLVQLAQKEQGK